MIKNIREIDRDIPAIIITAYNDNKYLLDAIKLNVSDYIIKPFDSNNLFEKLQTAYLPIHQKKLLETQNLELKKLNQKIKNVAKEEIKNIKKSYDLEEVFSNDDVVLDFNNIIDNVTIDD